MSRFKGIVGLAKKRRDEASEKALREKRSAAAKKSAQTRRRNREEAWLNEWHLKSRIAELLAEKKSRTEFTSTYRVTFREYGLEKKRHFRSLEGAQKFARLLGKPRKSKRFHEEFRHYSGWKHCYLCHLHRGLLVTSCEFVRIEVRRHSPWEKIE